MRACQAHIASFFVLWDALGDEVALELSSFLLELSSKYHGVLLGCRKRSSIMRRMCDPADFLDRPKGNLTNNGR